MKLIISGSRGINNIALLRHVALLATYKSMQFYDPIIEVVSGCCPNSPDMLGERFAADYGIPVKRFPAQWDTGGKSAGLIRNEQMAHYGDALLALWDGHSRGTYHMANFMGNLSKPTFLYNTATNRYTIRFGPASTSFTDLVAIPGNINTAHMLTKGE